MSRLITNCPVFSQGTAYITMDFGDTSIHKGGHKGIDIVYYVNGVNTTGWIKALASGTITAQRKWVNDETVNSPDFGNCVYIDHGNGLVSKYAHLAFGMPSWIKDNVPVDKGDTLGFMGNTGYATGAHLHFQLEENGVPIDPLPYLTGEKKIEEYNAKAYYIRTAKAFTKDEADAIVAALSNLGNEVEIVSG